MPFVTAIIDDGDDAVNDEDDDVFVIDVSLSLIVFLVFLFLLLLNLLLLIGADSRIFTKALCDSFNWLILVKLRWLCAMDILVLWSNCAPAAIFEHNRYSFISAVFDSLVLFVLLLFRATPNFWSIWFSSLAVTDVWWRCGCDVSVIFRTIGNSNIIIGHPTGPTDRSTVTRKRNNYSKGTNFFFGIFFSRKLHWETNFEPNAYESMRTIVFYTMICFFPIAPKHSCSSLNSALDRSTIFNSFWFFRWENFNFFLAKRNSQY